MKRLLLFSILSFSVMTGNGQDSLFRLSAFVDLYYAYDFNQPADRNRLYTTQPARHNEFNLNWGFIKAQYAEDRIRGTFALHAGTFVDVNYVAENSLARMIYQANVGYRLGSKTWIDVGIMPSHIGVESMLSIDNWNYGRNLTSDFSPYYQAGIHLSSELSGKVHVVIAILNGYQNIKETNDAKSLGLALSWKPLTTVEIGYSNYFGDEAPTDSVFVMGKLKKIGRRFRLFNDMFVRLALTKRLGLILIGEYSAQQAFEDKVWRPWHAVTVMSNYRISKEIDFALRVERFYDRHQVVSVTGTPEGFQVNSLTASLTHRPVANLAFRLEGRYYDSKDPIFPGREEQTKSSDFLGSLSMALKL